MTPARCIGSSPSAIRLVALLDVAGDDGHVAVVDDREVVEDAHAEPGVVAPEQVRGAPYALGAEAGADAEGAARVERGADDGGVGVLEVANVGQAHKGAHARKSWGLEGIGRLVAGHGSPLRSCSNAELVGQGLQVGNLQVGHGVGRRGSPEPLPTRAPVYPRGGEPQFSGGDHVVEEALRGVQ